jgi:3-oxoacyl-[acyl-carrier protein] reductase
MVLTSVDGIEGDEDLPLYSTVKGAQRGLVKSLAREWGPAGVRVNCLAPLALTPAL